MKRTLRVSGLAADGSLVLLGVLALLAGCDVRVEPAPQSNSTASANSTNPESAPRVARGLLRFVDGYEQGYAESRRTGKPLLLFFTAEWCHYCHQMADEAFTQPQVVNLSERFVCVLIDADNAPTVCRQFHVSKFPTMQFISPQGVALNRVEGKRPGHQVLMEMQTALQNVALRSETVGTRLR